MLFYSEVLWSELEDIRNPHPGGETRTVSCAPTLLLPVPMFGVALLMDESVVRWGTELVAGLHLVLAIFLMGAILRFKWLIRVLKRPNQSERD
ncbi:MAG: hypothetical protein K8U57_32470 [Planctomycetes bacterium]|nr:hypothetical protein [Planctomycetota bacterium]